MKRSRRKITNRGRVGRAPSSGKGELQQTPIIPNNCISLGQEVLFHPQVAILLPCENFAATGVTSWAIRKAGVQT